MAGWDVFKVVFEKLSSVGTRLVSSSRPHANRLPIIICFFFRYLILILQFYRISLKSKDIQLYKLSIM